MKHIRFTTIILSILFVVLPILTILMFRHITVSETLTNNLDERIIRLDEKY